MIHLNYNTIGDLIMRITRTSVISGKTRVKDIPVDPIDMDNWMSGVVSIEEVMPYLSDEHREFILGGIVPDEWETAFQENQEVAFG